MKKTRSQSPVERVVAVNLSDGTESERIAARCDGVSEYACMGISDETTDETVKVFVVKTDGRHVSEAGIIALCREHLAVCKAPGSVESIDEILKSLLSGKCSDNFRATFDQASICVTLTPACVSILVRISANEHFVVKID